MRREVKKGVNDQYFVVGKRFNSCIIHPHCEWCLYFIYFQSDKARYLEIKNEFILKLLNANKVHWIKLALDNKCVCPGDVLAGWTI